MYHIICLIECYAIRIYMVCIGFTVKIPLYQRFHTFLRQFHTFFHTILNFHLYQIIRLLECYKNTYSLPRFLVKIPLYWRFHILLKQVHTFFHTFFGEKNSPYIFPHLYQHYKKIQKKKINNSRDMLQKGEKSLFITPILPFLAK